MLWRRCSSELSAQGLLRRPVEYIRTELGVQGIERKDVMAPGHAFPLPFRFEEERQKLRALLRMRIKNLGKPLGVQSLEGVELCDAIALLA